MFKTRVALLGVLALLTASGITASMASAAGPYWHVNGSKLGQGATRQVKLQAKGITIFKEKIVGSITIVIECHNSYAEGAGIEGVGNLQGQDKGRIVFEQCKTVFKPAEACTVVEPIKTNQLKSYLAYNKALTQQKFVDVFEPQQRLGFIVLRFSGSGCLLTEDEVIGSVAAEIVPIEKEAQELLLNFPEEPITSVIREQQERSVILLQGSEQVMYSGAYGARLATNEPWGVFGQ
jgi:hypothetical protein